MFMIIGNQYNAETQYRKGEQHKIFGCNNR